MSAAGSNEEADPPPSLPSREVELSRLLWEAAVGADWDEVCNLCDEYSKAAMDNEPNGGSSSRRRRKRFVIPEDPELFKIIDAVGDDNRKNPLMAAVLHAAIDIASSRSSCSLFSDCAARELVDAEERRRLHSGGLSAFDDPLTVKDFCPYAAMAKYGGEGYAPHIVDEARRRARRKAIAKLCRANPLWVLLPMLPRGRKRYEDDPSFDDELPRGTTPLHIAVRSRSVALTRLLVKHCPKAGEIADVDGCVPLHYAVRPMDETTVLRRAVVTYQRSLIGGIDSAPAEVSFCMLLVVHVL